MTDGLSVTPAAHGALAGDGGGRPLTLDDYASTSGVALELKGEIWVNAPMAAYNSNFIESSPHHTLDFDGARFFVRSGDLEVTAKALPVPGYHDESMAAGGRYTDFAITHTDRVRISPIQGCRYVCTFCDLPYDKRYQRMPLEGLLESVRRALADETLPAHHVLISGGVPRDEDWPWLNEVYEAVPAEFPDVAVDVMMVPVPDLLDARWLHRCGIQNLSINLEMYDTAAAMRIMPQKARLGSEVWFDFIEEAVELYGPGRVRSLLMVGIEPLEMTLRGVAALAERGCEPVLSPFRPDPATPLRKHPPPSVELLEEAYQRSAEIADRFGVKLGPRCIPCMHNTLSFPDGSDYYFRSAELRSAGAAV